MKCTDPFVEQFPEYRTDPYSEPLDKYLMHPTEDVKNFAIDRIKVLGADKYGK